MVRISADGKNEELVANKRTKMAYHNVLFSFCYIINSCEQNFAPMVEECVNNKKKGVPLECCRALAMLALEFLSKNHNDRYDTSKFHVGDFFSMESIENSEKYINNKFEAMKPVEKSEYINISDYFKALRSSSAESEDLVDNFFSGDDFKCIVNFSTMNQDPDQDSFLLTAANILQEIQLDKKSSGTINTLIVNIIFLKQLLEVSQQGDFKWLKNTWLRLCYILYKDKYFLYKNDLEMYKFIDKEYKDFKEANPHLLLKESIDPKKDLRVKIKFIYFPIRQEFALSEFEIEENLFNITHSLFKMRECHESVPEESVEFIKSVIINKLFNYTKIAKTSKDNIIGNCLDNYYYIFSKSIDVDAIEQKKNAQ